MACQVIVDNISREDWERYAANFADYSIYQTWEYQEVRAKMDGQVVSRVIVKDERDKVATMCQVRIKHVKLLGLKIGYVQWGPLFRCKDGKSRCSIEALKKLRAVYLGNRLNVLRIVPNSRDDEFGRTFAEMLQSAGFTSVQSIEPYRTFILPVDDSEDGIRKRLRKSFRRDLKKAESSTIEIREGKGKECCAILEKLYVELLRRKKFKGLNPQEFIKTQALLSNSEKMNIILAYKDNEPVAAHLATNLGDTAVVLLAASNEKGLACGSSYIIWYRGALAACRVGMKLYDLGGIDPENNPTVYQFKSRMGGKDQSHVGAFEAYTNCAVRTIWRMSERVYNLIRK
ncbi:MAG: lipid II:glycine glycyltransferase FemX [Planctomycetota bacterium]|jgi:lipid II:glycine glycyltransferase (peptidoglycan interpeptide bridge formation enzyme)